MKINQIRHREDKYILEFRSTDYKDQKPFQNEKKKERNKKEERVMKERKKKEGRKAEIKKEQKKF